MVYIAAGMLVFWIATFVFIFSISRRQRRVEEELAALQDSAES